MYFQSGIISKKSHVKILQYWEFYKNLQDFYVTCLRLKVYFTQNISGVTNRSDAKIQLSHIFFKDFDF